MRKLFRRIRLAIYRFMHPFKGWYDEYDEEFYDDLF